MIKRAALLFVFGFILTLAAYILTASLREFLPPLIPLWYTQKWGPSRLSSPQNLFLVAAISFGILFLNGLLCLFLKSKREEVIAQVFAALALSSSFFLGYSVWRIINLVSPKSPSLVLRTSLLLPFVVAFAFSASLTGAALKIGRRLRLIDRPHGPYEKVRPLVRLGGISLFASFALSVLIFANVDKHLVALLAGGLILIMVGLMDDLYHLPPWVLGISHLLAALSLVLGGLGMSYVRNPLSLFFGGAIIHLDVFKIPFIINGVAYHLNLLADLLTVLWVFSLINIVNWLDGLDGLAAGVGLIASLTLFAISFKFGTPLPMMLSLIVAGVLLGFLPFNFSPAKIILGSGGYLLGFFLATLSILSEGRAATALLVLSLPVLDTLIVLINRFRTGKPLYLGDKTHLHHRLLDKGLTVRQVVILEWGICSGLGASSLFLTGLGKLLVVGLVLGGGLALNYLPGARIAKLKGRRPRLKLG